MRISDDGRGFDAQPRPEQLEHGFGLVSMAERAEAFGGQLRLAVRAGPRHRRRSRVPMTTRVVLADDHAPTRAGVRLALEHSEFGVVAEATTAAEAVSAALRHRPDVCLLDIYMPGGGIEAAGEIRERASRDTALVMLTASDSDDDLFAALRAGATGYLPKTTAADRLAPALRGVLAGEAALPRHAHRPADRGVSPASGPRTHGARPARTARSTASRSPIASSRSSSSCSRTSTRSRSRSGCRSPP